ncbi:ABC transporter ATP-binding protein [Microbacterium sp.]|uniref:ABC transporter ATP-binding protein n=1 Tax=Microbacterium sp. TaxID=51671 RepID=UPI003C78D888
MNGTAPTSTALIAARNIVKSYGTGANRFEALKGVSFDIREGESVAIVGKSGSGKSTLMHVLALLDSPDGGELLLAGQDTARLRGRALNRTRNRTFGFVFQQFFLTANQTVLENVVLPLRIAGVARGERRRRGMAALEQLQLADKARNKATALSGGQKQRAVIARALVNDPRIIFADEPTGNLDSATGAVVEDILFALNREHGITLIVVTHDDDLAARCDRRIHIRDGRITTDDGARPTEGAVA